MLFFYLFKTKNIRTLFIEYDISNLINIIHILSDLFKKYNKSNILDTPILSTVKVDIY